MRQLIGHCAVDSGQLMLIDPCYIIASENDSEEYKASHHVTYEEVIEAWGTKKMFVDDFHLGVITRTGWGDGFYPVYADIVGNRVKSVTVEFMDEDEE
jgi:hypothetical protein